jgi:hypothetical protein
MMDHGKVEDQLLEFIYGELAESEAKEVREHLSGCVQCSGEVAKLTGVRAAMAGLPQAAPSASVTAAILRRAAELAPKRTRRWSLASFFLRPSVAGAFVFLLLLGVGLSVVRFNSDEPAPDTMAVTRFVANTPAPAAAPPVTAAPAMPEPRLGERRREAPAVADRAVDELAPPAEEADRPPRKKRKSSPRIVARVARPTPDSLFPAKEKAMAKAAPTTTGERAAPVERGFRPAGAAGGGNRDLAMGFGAKDERAATPAPLAAAPAPPPAPAPETAKGAPESGYQILGRASRPPTVAAEPNPTDANKDAFRAEGEREQSEIAVTKQQRLDERQRQMAAMAEPSASGRAAPESLLRLAERQIEKGEIQSAIATLERLLRSNPGYSAPRAYELLISAYERKGDRRAADLARARARRHFDATAAERAKASTRPAASPPPAATSK